MDWFRIYATLCRSFAKVPISSSDPLRLGLATVLIVVVATASALLPARRATKVDPVVALRYE